MAGKVLIQTAADVAPDYLIARATGTEFDLVESLKVNAGINVVTLGMEGTVAKVRKLATLAVKHGDEAMDLAWAGARVLGSEGAEQAVQALTRERVIQALGEVIQPYLKRLRKIAGEDAKIGFRSSLARGTVGNPKKPTFGQPINLNDFDVDVFIVSDEPAARYGDKRRGDQIDELKNIQRAIEKALRQRLEFAGLRKDGSTFRIFTRAEAE